MKICSERNSRLKGPFNEITLGNWSASVNQEIPRLEGSKENSSTSGRVSPGDVCPFSQTELTEAQPVRVTHLLSEGSLWGRSVPHPLPESWLLERLEKTGDPVPLFTHCHGLNCDPQSYIVF